MDDSTTSFANPYRRIGPKHDLVVERRAYLKALRARLEEGRSVALIGSPGAGKSQLCRSLYKHYFGRFSFLPHALAVSIDPSASSPAAWLQTLHHRLRKEIDRRGFNWGDVPQVSDWSRALPALLEDMDRLLAALFDEGLSVILVIEPLDQAGADAIAPLLTWLAGWVREDVQLLTTARDVRALPTTLQDRVDPIEVGPFTHAEADEFLTRPLEGHPAALSTDERAALVLETGGLPGPLLEAAARAVERKLEASRTTPEAP